MELKGTFFKFRLTIYLLTFVASANSFIWWSVGNSIFLLQINFFLFIMFNQLFVYLILIFLYAHIKITELSDRVEEQDYLIHSLKGNKSKK